jgi:hypothetical protein
VRINSRPGRTDSVLAPLECPIKLQSPLLVILVLEVHRLLVVHIIVLDQAVWIILEEIVDCLTFTWIGSDQKIDKAQNIPGNGRLGHDRTQHVVAGILVIPQA